MGALSDCWTEVANALDIAGVPNTTDPSKVRPGVALVDPPRIVTGRSGYMSDVEVDVTVPGIPPGTPTVVAALLDQVDEIVTVYPVTTARHGVLSVNGQDLPAVIATIRLTISRP